MSMSESMYKVFVIDKMYFYNKNNVNTPSYNLPTKKKREIKTNHWSSFVENIKKTLLLFTFKYYQKWSCQLNR